MQACVTERTWRRTTRSALRTACNCNGRTPYRPTSRGRKARYDWTRPNAPDRWQERWTRRNAGLHRATDTREVGYGQEQPEIDYRWRQMHGQCDAWGSRRSIGVAHRHRDRDFRGRDSRTIGGRIRGERGGYADCPLAVLPESAFLTDDRPARYSLNEM